MCRLMGAVLFEGYDKDRNYNEISKKLINLMHIGEMYQGGDGNGAVLFGRDDKTVAIYKSHLIASADQHNLADFLSPEQIEASKYVMLHTRLSTSGDSSNYANLHPFIQEDIIGAHNGIIWSHEYLWKKFEAEVGKPVSENDSEIIFALLDARAKGLDPQGIIEALEDVDGVLAISAFSRKDPNKYLLVSRENPVAFFFDVNEGILWYASTPQILADADVCKATDATALRYEMMLIDYANMSWTYEDVMPTTYGMYTPARSKYAYKEETYYEDMWITHVDGEASPSGKVNSSAFCICDGKGYLTEEEYEIEIGSDFINRNIFENEFDELCVLCPICEAADKKVSSY